MKESGLPPHADMRVLFWGTPEFALPALRAIESAGHEVAGVVTRPDRPRGRGRKRAPSPVRRYAESRGHRVLTPGRPRDGAFVELVREIAPDVSVVVAYGHILSRELLEAPRLGSLNVHASLLPALRGAAPVNWAVARGHTVTGVTVMRMVEAMDAGPVLARAEIPIGETDTASLLSPRLAELGAVLLAETLARLEEGPVEEVEQDHDAATYAPKVSRATARIDWTEDARAVACLIRGMDAVPGAWSVLKGQPVKLFAPEVVEGESDGGPDPGRVVGADSRVGLVVMAGGGSVRIGEVQPAGKRRMEAVAWMLGRG
ncbi:MAG: methionyl-tRNA formyltransferase, partial [Gemmatimonadetes bacterium]|nr:methionyl-tRNA formyltransferase [Gemmatimonadota bacterium]